MLEEEIEERLETLERKVEELITEVRKAKPERDEEVHLIPGAEYDFVPTIEEKVISRGVGRIVKIEKAPHDLGLSAREWELLSSDEEKHE